MSSIRFIPMQEVHLKLFRSWLQKPHIKPVWQETQDDEELKHKFLVKLPQLGVQPFVFEVDQKILGYIQYYAAHNMGDGWWENEVEGTYGIDLMIGEESKLNQGLGPKVIEKFISKLRQDKINVQSVIIDPEPTNHRAIRAFEKAGFVREKELTTPNGKALLMRRVFKEIELREIRKLDVSAASGLVLLDQAFYVVADDELTLYKYAQGSYKLIEKKHLITGDLPEVHQVRKKLKPDFETLVYLPQLKAILAVPSGSTLNRTVGVLVQKNITTEIYFESLYHKLSESISDLNIEGAAVQGANLKLFHRGNGKDQKNFAIDLDLRKMLDEIQHDQRLSAELVTKKEVLDLGQIQGHVLGVTDVAAESDELLWFVAVAEATESSYDDGEYLGAVLGCLDSKNKILFKAEINSKAKPEGLALDLENQKFYLVTDADDRSQQALLFEGNLPTLNARTK